MSLPRGLDLKSALNATGTERAASQGLGSMARVGRVGQALWDEAASFCGRESQVRQRARPQSFLVMGPGLPSIPGLGEPQGSSAFQMKTLPLAKQTVCRAK